jgi:hypothetical protein
VQGSVNDNEPYYDEDRHVPEALEDSDDLVIDQTPFTSADPHRTLQPASELMKPAAQSESIASRIRESRQQAAQGMGSAKPTAQTDLGPCLYFGPAGQRCDRRATAGGFCARHQPKGAGALGETRSVSIPQISKRALGAAGILAVVWPILYDLIRELLRLLR